MQKFRKENYIYYINIRFFYEKLCKEHTSINNCNFLVYNSAFYNMYKGIKDFISSLTIFVSTKDLNTGNDYLDFSEKVKKFKRISTENYKLLTNSTYKDEYQKNIFRLIIEGLLNHPINSVGGYFLVHEEIGNYEELLQKQFSTTRHMIIILNLNNMKSKIIKIGKEFIQYLNKSIEFLFPIQFSCLAKKIFYNEIKHIKETISDKQIFRFVIKDNHGNLKNFVYTYKIFPNLQMGIAYIDGHYQIGKEPLILNEKCGKNECIVSVSNKLQKKFLVNQEFINLLNKYEIKIFLKDIISNANDLSYTCKSFSTFFNRIKTDLFNICSQSDIEIIKDEYTKISSTISGSRSITFKMENICDISDKENEKEFYIYQIVNMSSTVFQTKISNQTKAQTLLSQTMDETVNQISGIQNNSTLGSMDNCSMMSQSSLVSSFTVIHTLAKKKSEQETRAKHNNYIIIGLNICVIGLSVFCLTYEDQLN